MTRIAIFDATPGADYWPCGHYDAPFAPAKGDRMYLSDSPTTDFKVVERRLHVNQTTGETTAIIHVEEIKPKKGWFR